MDSLNKTIINHWKQLRKMSLDLLNEITSQDLGKRLPFKRSQTLGFQYYCMLGTQETFVRYYLEGGVWKDWSCSLKDQNTPNKKEIKKAMQQADKKLYKLLVKLDLLKKVGDGTPLHRYLILVEHESHHQGQLINFIYAHDLPIPKSWHLKWALQRN